MSTMSAVREDSRHLGVAPHDVLSRANALAERIRRRSAEINFLWLETAEDLYAFHSERLWAFLGHETLEAWLASEDSSVERRWAFDLIAIWRLFVVEGNIGRDELRDISPSKLQVALTAVRRGRVTAATAVADARELSRTEMRTRYAEPVSLHEATLPFQRPATRKNPGPVGPTILALRFKATAQAHHSGDVAALRRTLEELAEAAQAWAQQLELRNAA